MSLSRKLSNKQKDYDNLDILDFEKDEEGVTSSECSCGGQLPPTHFCCSLECLKPLCSDCRDAHSLDHENSFSSSYDIETLPSVRQKCLKKLKAAVSSLSAEILQTEKLYLQPEADVIKEGQKKLQEARVKLIKFVENFFEEQEEIFRRRISENRLKTEDISN